jgi:hypothetical protein
MTMQRSVSRLIDAFASSWARLRRSMAHCWTVCQVSSSWHSAQRIVGTSCTLLFSRRREARDDSKISPVSLFHSSQQLGHFALAKTFASIVCTRALSSFFGYTLNISRNLTGDRWTSKRASGSGRKDNPTRSVSLFVDDDCELFGIDDTRLGVVAIDPRSDRH